MTVIVGTDGTSTGTVAVAWAAAEAQRRRTSLRIVHAYDRDWHESRFDIGNEYLDVARTLAEGVVAAAEEHARAAAPAIEVQTGMLAGHPVPRLLEVTRGAELLVLGSRGHGVVGGLLVGSVSQRLATYAPCPVAVVRGRKVPDGLVAAGVDDTADAEQVLRAAFDAAADRACPLVVIRSFRPPTPRWLADLLPVNRTPEEDAAERNHLQTQVEPWRAKYPDVAVETVLTYDSPAGALLAASHWAQLVVVGSRGHGVAGGTLLGSTSLRLLHHAESPVLIARLGESR